MAGLQRHSGTLKEKLQEEFLSCKICLESLRRPKALPCLHSFCESCLKDYVRRHPGGRPGFFPCPMCRKETYIPPNGVEGFPDNFVLLSLSDTLLEDEEDRWSQSSFLDTSSSSSGVSSSSSLMSIQGPASPPRHLYPPSPRELRHRNYDWYFGKVSRDASEDWLLATGYPRGTFLVRQGEASPGTYTLSVRDYDDLRGYLAKHYKIVTRRPPDHSCELYYITKSRTFTSLADLVKHYQDSVDGLCCKLTQTCAKPRSLLWAMERGKQDEYTSTKDTLHLVKRLGSGQFAEVWLAKWNLSKEVAVKMQKIDCVSTEAFLDEAQILKTLQHPNIISLVGVCCQNEPVYLLMEYMANGRLSLYLREGPGKDLPVSQLIYIGAQIADAMAYMEKENFIHRNLGARNILVGQQNKVKVAGFGMTRTKDDPDFNLRKGLKMAIKWMAPEVLSYNKHSTRADVWSFGVVLMEIFTYGKEPYEGMPSKEAFESVQQGYRMLRPDACPPEVYDVILSCWQTNCHSRPSFDFLNTFLNDYET
ncbi:hypothetical protein ACOMHN_066395 [Nucella lapillus]